MGSFDFFFSLNPRSPDVNGTFIYIIQYQFDYQSFRNLRTRRLESIICIRLRFSLIQFSDFLAELHRAQDAALNLRNIARDDHLSRAKICSKLVKYPNISDYKVSFAEYDQV